MLQISVNGETHKVGVGTTLAKLLEGQQLLGKRLAIEVNEEIIPRSQVDAYELRQGDRVEIVQAIGGG